MSLKLRTPFSIGSMTLANRLYRAPVLEGVSAMKDPAQGYAKHFVPNAEAGVGLIIQGNTIVVPEGRTAPGMSTMREKKDMLSLSPMVTAVRAHGTKIVAQLGHGGQFAVEAWHADFRAKRSHPPFVPSPTPMWMRPIHGAGKPMTTKEVEELIERFGVVARWAREAGYDGVQLAGSNAKLLHQFLSPVYNRRGDRYGGSLSNRMRLLGDIRRSIARYAGEDYPVLLKYAAVEEGAFWGTVYGLSDGVRLAKLAEEAGFDALTPVIANSLPTTAVARGVYPRGSFENASLNRRLTSVLKGRVPFYSVQAAMWLASRRYPFEPMWNRQVFATIKRAVSIPVFAVGGIRTPAEAEKILDAGDADLIGVGRPFYAEPDLPRRWLTSPGRASLDGTACQNCNRCFVPQMIGLQGGCYNPGTKRRAKELRQRFEKHLDSPGSCGGERPSRVSRAQPL